MYTITGGGSFTRTNIDQINSNFSELSGSAGAGSASGLSVWVRPSYGNNNNVGTYDKPFATLSGPNATLYVGGTGDVWGANVGSDDFFFGVPDNS